jgi:hypothetical protein
MEDSMSVPHLRRHQHVDLLPYQLLGAIPEQGLDLVADEADRALTVDRHERSRHRVDQKLQLPPDDAPLVGDVIQRQ